jgi:hypothetical protein
VATTDQHDHDADQNGCKRRQQNFRKVGIADGDAASQSYLHQ